MLLTERQRLRASVGGVRLLLIAGVLLTFGFASPIYMQDEPPPDEAPIAEPDIAATVQVAVAGTVSAWLTSLPTPAPTATATPTAISPITLKGRGELNTTAFRLDGGNYTVDWTATSQATPCYHRGQLRAVDGSPVFESVGSATVDKGKSFSGTTQIYNVKPNAYFLDMSSSSSCDWSVTITSQR